MGILEILNDIRDKLKGLSAHKGAKVRKQRNELRRAARKLKTGSPRATSGRKKGDDKGAFGAPRGPFDASPAVSPKLTDEQKEERRKQRNRRRKLAA